MSGISCQRVWHAAWDGITVGYRRRVTIVTRFLRWRRRKTRLQAKPFDHFAGHKSLWFLACIQVLDRANLWYRNDRSPRVRIAKQNTRIFRREAGDLIKKGGWLRDGMWVTQHSSGCLSRFGCVCLNFCKHFYALWLVILYIYILSRIYNTYGDLTMRL